MSANTGLVILGALGLFVTALVVMPVDDAKHPLRSLTASLLWLGCLGLTGVLIIGLVFNVS